MIKNSIIGENVNIKDGAKVGLKGFGFIPIKQKNLRTPQIGKVILNDGVEIGSNCTINRGSISDTVIGKNTFLDDHIHIAHNVRVGENCIMAAQVGISGSTIIGDNTVIGGQAGISGHLIIGNNVKIGGASGVTTDISDNSQVMGYPAVPLRDFVKMRRKNDKNSINKKEIELLLPHREPMLLIDKLTNIVPLKSATAIINVKKHPFLYKVISQDNPLCLAFL